MAGPGPGRTFRRISVQMLDGAFDAALSIGEAVRTLDDVNMVSARFLTLHESYGLLAGLRVDGGPVALNKEHVLFIMESEPPAVPPGNRAAAAIKCHRAGIRLRLGEFTVEGWVNVPFGGKAVLRLKQEGHMFLAVTGARVSGPGGVFETPFIAINRLHVSAAVEVATPCTDMDPVNIDRPAARPIVPAGEPLS